MSTIEVCAVCELPHPCPSGHNCGSLTREVPDTEKSEPVSKSRNTDPEVRGGEFREEWDPSATEPPEQEPVVYENHTKGGDYRYDLEGQKAFYGEDVLPADTEDSEALKGTGGSGPIGWEDGE